MIIEEQKYNKILKNEFLEKKLNCFSTAIRGGLKEYGLVDVIGVRDIEDRRYNEIEMITIEVKSRNRIDSFLKSLGEAKCYSIFSHLPYLAIDKEFTSKEKYIANKFGVGLIEIGEESQSITEVVSPNKHKPIYELFYEVLNESLLVYQCFFCKKYYKIKKDELVLKYHNYNICTHCLKKIDKTF